MLGKQLHIIYDGQPLKEGFSMPIVPHLGVKARGGLWTSTYDEDLGSDWVQWSIDQEFRVPEDGLWDGYILTPSTEAKILVVDSEEDLKHVFNEYRRKPIPHEFIKEIDFMKIASEFDAMTLTWKGQMETRFSFPYSLYGWDCESTHWFKWKFEKMERIDKVEFKERVF